MKIWLDDIRNPPDSSWRICRTAEEAIGVLFLNHVQEISFDHDLGENIGTGYDVAKFIARQSYLGDMMVPIWTIHSQNPVGRVNIQRTMEWAENNYLKGKGQKYSLEII